MPIDHTKSIIEVKNLSFAYSEETVLKNISFNIHKGDYLGIIGPNGGGKTTLLKLMVGLLPLQTGEIRIDNTPIKKFKNWSKVGYVSQKAVQIDSKFPATVEEVVMMGRCAKRGLFRRSNKEDKRMVERALMQVDMASYKSKLIGDLSGGQQQRVCIARALAGEPEIIFLDEPTVGIDVHTQEQFYRLLRELNTKLKVTLVLVSHDIDVVAHETTELACINQTLVYHGSPKEFIKGDYVKDLYSKELKFILHDHGRG